MAIVEYEARFYELARHTTSILGTVYEMVHCFVRGLTLPFHISTQSLVASCRTSAEVSNHA